MSGWDGCKGCGTEIPPNGTHPTLADFARAVHPFHKRQKTNKQLSSSTRELHDLDFSDKTKQTHLIARG